MGRIRSRLGRRPFLRGGLALLGLGLLTGCGRLPFPGQSSARVPRIAYVGATAANPYTQALADGLRELGYVEGQNLAIEWRATGGSRERIPEVIAELMALGIDALVVTGVTPAKAAQEATAAIPIVFVMISDPLENGIVTNLARPGGNVTGLGSFQLELSGRQLQLLSEAAPATTRVGVLWQGSHPGKARQVQEIRDAAPALGLGIESLPVGDPRELAGAVETGIRAGIDALFALNSDLTAPNRARIVELAARARLPAMYETGEWTADGGLLSYGPSFSLMHRRAAYFVDRILKGTPPGDLPVERPTALELVINLKAAQALGLVIPQSVLAQATEVIQ